MRRLSLALSVSVLLVFISPTFGVPAATIQPAGLCGSVPCIEVGTFNIEWFGTTDTSKHKHRSSLAIKQIADLIAKTLDLEVVVLEEINSESEEFEKLKAALGEHGYKLISGTSGGEQRVVIAYDDDEIDLIGQIAELQVRSSFQLSGNCQSAGLRRPLMGTFRAGNFDFVLVGVHLKAQPGAPCSHRVREEQNKDLIAKVNELVNSSNERDVIIAGDFNATSNDTSLNPLLLNTGFADLTKPNRLANGSNTISYLEAPFQEIIDHLLVRLSDTTEWINKSTFIFNPPTNPTQLGKYLTHVSDHAPTWASFRTGG